MSWAAAAPLVGKVIDKLFPDADNSDQAKVVLAGMMINGEIKELAEQAGIITAEARGESWLQRCWRPLVILVFTALVVCRWMGWAAPDLSEEVELKLLSIVQLCNCAIGNWWLHCLSNYRKNFQKSIVLLVNRVKLNHAFLE